MILFSQREKKLLSVCTLHCFLWNENLSSAICTPPRFNLQLQNISANIFGIFDLLYTIFLQFSSGFGCASCHNQFHVSVVILCIVFLLFFSECNHRICIYVAKLCTLGNLTSFLAWTSVHMYVCCRSCTVSPTTGRGSSLPPSPTFMSSTQSWTETTRGSSVLGS